MQTLKLDVSSLSRIDRLYHLNKTKYSAFWDLMYNLGCCMPLGLCLCYSVTYL